MGIQKGIHTLYKYQLSKKQSKMAATVLIADDHPLILEGLVKQIESEKDFKIIARAQNGREAWDIYKKEHPDVLVLDIDMDEINGIDLTTKIKKENPLAKILLLTMHTEPWIIYRAKTANPDGILLKNSSIIEIISALKEILRGNQVYSQDVQNHIMEGSLMNQALLKLTTRETEVLKLIARGLSSKDIAEELCISINTVETYRKNLFLKFKVGNMAALIKKAIETGVVN